MLANSARNLWLAVEKRAGPAFPSPESGLRVASMAVNALLVIALAHALAGLTASVLWGHTPLSGGTGKPAMRGAAAGQTTVNQPADYAAISAWHLFGEIQADQPVAVAPPPAPVAPLNLRLVGVFFIEWGVDRALALIAEGSGVERGYRVGETLPGGARLDQIRRDNVVVTRGDRQETLNLPRLEEIAKTARPGGMPLPGSEEAPMPEPMPMPMPAEPGMVPAPSSYRPPPPFDATAVAARLRAAVTSRPQALEDIAFASPYLQNGRFMGFRLQPGRDRQLMRQLGLNSGDVITEVNGNRLSNPMQGMIALRDLMQADRVTVRVLRGGTEIPLAFSLGGQAVR